jgi:Xaa-Pro aminopeptidase
MKSDIDRLMNEAQVDAILVTGSGENNPAMVYLTGGLEVTQADYFKIAGEEPILFHSPIERDGAIKAGIPLVSYSVFPYKKLLEEAAGDAILAAAYRYREMFKTVDLQRGKVAVYGEIDLGRGYSILSNLKRFFPDLDFEISTEQDILRRARVTKDSAEILRIRKVGEATIQIVSEIANFLSSHRTKRDTLVKSNGDPLTIGDVKTKLRVMLAERNLQAENTIFAIGREAGVPHNMGGPNSPLRLGETIIFDAYFQESGGGYWYDFTRTWCLGFAPDQAQQLYEQVALVHRQVAANIEAGKSFHQYQIMASEMFDEMGHATIESQPDTRNGYVHGLGHGVGLEIHEMPSSAADLPENILKPGMIITIEPGLYYPENGMGIRIEDTYFIDSDGKAKKLVDYPWELVLSVS